MIFCFPKCILAHADGNQLDALAKVIEDQLNALELGDLDDYLRRLTGEKTSVFERILAYIDGENASIFEAFSNLLTVFSDRVQALTPAFASVVAIAILTGILTTLKEGDGVSETLRFIALISVFVPISAVLFECYDAVKSGVVAMQTQMQLIFPLLLTLIAGSGGTVTATVATPSVNFLSTQIVHIAVSIVLPIAFLTILFAFINAFAEGLDLGKFTVFFKSVNQWILGAITTIFGLFFSVQGIVSVTKDTVTRRATKYAISTGVPIVGGFLSSGFDLAIAGSVVLKNSIGGIAIFMMVTVLLEPLILLVATSVFLRLTAGVTAPLGERKIADLLTEIANLLNVFTAVLCIVALLYFLTVVACIFVGESFL